MNPPQPSSPPRLASAHPVDTELEAAMISVRAMVDLRDRLSSAETDRDYYRTQMEIWKARAESEARLNGELKHERDFYQGFTKEIVTTCNIVNSTLVAMMTKARDNAYRPPDREQRPSTVEPGPGDDGAPIPEYLREHHLQERQPDDK